MNDVLILHTTGPIATSYRQLIMVD